MIQINDRNDDEARHKEKIVNKTQRNPEGEIQIERAKGGHSLNHWILNGDRGLAIPAFSPEEKVTDDRDIIVKPYRDITFRAMGPRPNNRLLFWKPADADIQKTTHHRPK